MQLGVHVLTHVPVAALHVSVDKHGFVVTHW
jgi:hypothetical protein